MMRPSLLHPRGEPHSRRRHRRRTASLAEPILEPTGEPIAEPTAEPILEPTAEPIDGAPARACDPVVERVRAAGGPVDQASYGCACGYTFSASVSTTVTCPHCGADQAW